MAVRTEYTTSDNIKKPMIPKSGSHTRTDSFNPNELVIIPRLFLFELIFYFKIGALSNDVGRFYML